MNANIHEILPEVLLRFHRKRCDFEYKNAKIKWYIGEKGTTSNYDDYYIFSRIAIVIWLVVRIIATLNTVIIPFAPFARNQ